MKNKKILIIFGFVVVAIFLMPIQVNAKINSTTKPTTTPITTPTKTPTTARASTQTTTQRPTKTITQTPTRTNKNSTNEKTSNRKVAVEVSKNVYIESYSFDDKNSTVTIVFNQYNKNIPNRVTVSNFLYKIDGGVKDFISRTYLIQGKTEITFGLKKINNEMAVMIEEHGNTKLLTWSGSILNFDNSYTTQETGIFMLSGVFIGITVVTGVAIKRKWEVSNQVKKRL